MRAYLIISHLMYEGSVKLKKWILIIAGILLALAAVILLSSAVFLGVFLTKDRLQQLLSHTLLAKVTIGKLDHRLSLNHLDLNLSNIHIQPRNTQYQLSIKTLRTKLNIWSSLLHTYPATDKLSIDGLNATIVLTHPANQILLPTHKLSQYLREIILQRHLLLKNGNITLKQNNHTSIFSHIQLQLNKINAHTYHLTGSAKNNHIKAIDIKAELDSTTFSPKVNAYLSLTGINFDRFSIPWPKGGLNIQHVGGSLQAWITLNNNQLTQIQSRFLLNKLNMINVESKRTLSFQHLSENLLWQQKKSGWLLSIEPFGMTSMGQKNAAKNNHMLLQYKPLSTGEIFNVYLGHIKLNTLTHALHLLPNLPTHLVHALDAMNPQGKLDQLYIDILHNNTGYHPITIDSDIHNFRINQYKKIPQVSGIFGHLHATTNWGTLQLNTHQFILGKNIIFSHPWPKTALKADLSWQKTGDLWNFSLKSLYADNTWIHFFAYGTGKYSTLLAGPILQLSANTQIKNATEILPAFVPTKIITPKLNHWLLTNIKSAPKLSAKMVLSGPMSHLPFMAHRGVFSIHLSAHNAKVIPWYHWPMMTHADVNMIFYNAQFKLLTQKAQMLGAQLVDGQLSVPDLRKGVPTDVIINAAAKGQAASGAAILTHSPLLQSFHHALSMIKLEGPIMLHLNMRFPLKRKKTDHPAIRGDLSITNNQLTIIALNMLLTNVSGNLHFDHLAMFSTDIKANLWAQPLRITIDSKQDSKMPHILHKSINITGHLNLNQIFTQLHYPVFSQYIKGTVPVKAIINIEPTSTSLNLYSSLQGLSLLLPAPLYKEPLTTLPLHFHTTIPDNKSIMAFKFSINHVLNVLAQYPRGTSDWAKHLQANVHFGNRQQSILPLKGIRFSGNIAYFSLAKWLDVFKTLKNHLYVKSTSNQGVQQYLSLIGPSDLTIQMLNVYQQYFPQTTLGFVQNDQNTQLSLNGPSVVGKITLPNQLHTLNIEADFKKLFLTTLSKQQKSWDLSLIQLTSIPPLAITILQLYVNQGLLGKLDLATIPSKQGLDINKFEVTGKTLSAKLKGSLVKQNLTTHVALRGNLSSENWGDVLKQLGFPGIITGGNGQADINVTWAKAVWPIPWAMLNGHLTLDIKDGALTKVNPGIVRLLGIFSVSSIFRRLKMNFNDLVAQGLAFDRLQSKFLLKNGVASTQDFRLTAPGVDFTMKGTVDFNKKYLDQTIVASPNIEGGIALGAGIFGGPIAGIAAWFAEKVLSNTLFKDKGIAYRMKGPFHSPTVTKIR